VTETTQRTGPKGPDDPTWTCPYSRLDEKSQVIRRQDIMGLSDTFKESLSPLLQILGHMKELNARWSQSNHVLRRVTAFQLLLSGLSLGGLCLMVMTLWYTWRALLLLDEHTAKLGHLEQQFGAHAQQLEALRVTAQSTEVQVAEVREGQEQKAQLELVPETDPVKALRAPVKLRVMAPVASATASVAPPVAEIPLPVGEL
jgi:hypothetical protein